MTTAKTLASQGTTIKIGNGESPEVFNTIKELRSITGPGGQAAVIDTTTLDSTRREKRMGLPDEGQVTCDVNFDPTDTNGQMECLAARNDQGIRNFKITYSDGSIDAFAGFVLSFSKGNAVDGNTEATI